MKYLVLTILLALQASSPVPRKAISNTNQADQNVQSDTRNDKTSTTPSPPIENPDKSGIPKGNNGNQATPDENKAIKVSVPPIDVKKDLGDYLSIASSLLLTLITFAIAIYAAVQAYAAKRSADNEERTVRLTQRADVLLQDFEVHVDSTGKIIGRDTQFTLHIKNCGPTRASDVVFDFGISASGFKKLIAGSTYQKPPRVSIILGAGDSKTVTFDRLCVLFDGETIEKIADGRSVLSMSGKIKYTDVFGASYVVSCGGKYSASLQTIVADETKIEEHRPKAK
jgi:hypothetical protein